MGRTYLLKTVADEVRLLMKKCPACCVMIGRDRSSQQVGVAEHVWDAQGKAIAQLQIPPNTHQMLKSALIEEWRMLPQDEINNLICSMKANYEAFVAAKVDTFLIRDLGF
ncbi:hypothetical protein TNCV_1076571 [Trichonephila clavipes]|uniref:Uncharacterized protein n=1 Tax=Trichonephila clavipes TaxID=2585209 RepID=A0A8X6RKZ1_TRICX|nr:hypothetical protein TNCV_1076571 [Trichonephila clavipes]